MTATTDTPTVQPETRIPAWIDVDQIISPELRAEALAEVDRMKAFLTECRQRAAEYQSIVERVRDAFDAAHVSDVDPDRNGLYDALRGETGLEDLVEFGWLVGVMFSPDLASTPTEDYIIEVADRHGVSGTLVSAIAGNVEVQS